MYKQIAGDEKGHTKEGWARPLLLSPHQSSPGSSQVKAQSSHTSLSIPGEQLTEGRNWIETPEEMVSMITNFLSLYCPLKGTTLMILRKQASGGRAEW